ncbi:hypothetical protein C1Y12_08750 [Pseudomonas sp. FW305-47B]|nr:hypothetical protein C1Y10_04425 [Pseudomonas sp. FW305-122]PMU41197.1 hypothetical protein C1Y12_08750 [Pseudomonas sp. FW305-47B]PMX64139.1 hypothetical protein C1Y13_05110 [Pseudomonas sp. FW305-33]PMX70745.1 hypothetical protein C1X12_03530 [Pseudomonas sp. FW305-60]
MSRLPSSRAGSLPQVIAFQCGSEPARDGAATATLNPAELTQQSGIQMLLHQIRQPLDIALT